MPNLKQAPRFFGLPILHLPAQLFFLLYPYSFENLNSFCYSRIFCLIMLSCWIMFASLIATWCLSQTKKTPSSVTASQTAHVPGPQNVQPRSLSFIGLFLISIFYFFQFPQAFLILPLIQGSSVFTNFLPRFLIYFLKYLYIFNRTLSTVACCKLSYCLIQKNGHWLSGCLFYVVKRPYSFAMDFWLI